jgi:hypothetical protein
MAMLVQTNFLLDRAVLHYERMFRTDCTAETFRLAYETQMHGEIYHGPLRTGIASVN